MAKPQAGSSPPQSSLTSHALLLAGGLFFLSGAASLGYEVVWFKRFTQVWGSSSLAMAAVVGVFLAGLGAGAAVLGRRADRVRSPLVWYGGLEAVVGVLALFVPLELNLLWRLAPGLGSALGQSPVLHIIVRALMTLLVIGPPSFLMGGTLPMLVRHFGAARIDLERSLGWLYGINTLGGAVGCLVLGFAALPELGLVTTNYILAAASIGAGLAAIVLGRSTLLIVTPLAKSSTPASSIDRSPRFRILGAIATVTGLASLALQMVWTRQLAVLVGGSTYAFTACLGVFLAGIGVGGLLYQTRIRRGSDPRAVAVWVIFCLIASTVAGKFLIPMSTSLVGVLGPFRSDSVANAAICILAATVLQFVPTVCMGILLPLIVQISSYRDGHSGRAVGNLYAWNIAGSVFGAIVTMPVLVPALGIAWATAAALGLYVAAMSLLAPRLSSKMVLACFGGLLLMGISAIGLDPLRTDYGQYMYGYMAPDVRAGLQLLSHREGASSNVLVTQNPNGRRSIRVNGKVDAGTGNDVPMQLGSAYIPRMLHPESSDVLIVGFGSGCTSGASLLFPGTNVTCCEIEPEMIRASPFFHAINHEPELSDHFHPVIDDARNYLQTSSNTYDLIISEPSNPWIAGVASLYTADFYRVAASRLRPGGMLVQWVQAYSLRSGDYALIARTVLSAFPEAAVVDIDGGDTLIFASQQPITPTAETLDRAQKLCDSIPAVRADLRANFHTSDVRTLMLSHLLLDRADLERFARASGDATLNTDANLRLEYDAPRSAFVRSAKVEDLVSTALVSAATPDRIGLLWKAWRCGPAEMISLKQRFKVFTEAQCMDSARTLVNIGLNIDSKDPFFLKQQLTMFPDLKGDGLREAVTRLVDVSEADAFQAGSGLESAGAFERAADVFSVLAERRPNSAAAWSHLATCLARTGQTQAAEVAMKRAHEADPHLATVGTDAQP